MNLVSLLLKTICLTTIIGYSSVLANCSQQNCTENVIRNSFRIEEELNTWTDKSLGVVKWRIENCNSSWEPDNQVPCRESAKSHFRVDRGISPSFGVAVLSSIDFTLTKSETLDIRFWYWIRSKWPGFNSLRVWLFAFIFLNISFNDDNNILMFQPIEFAALRC